MAGNARRGFALMDPQRQKEIARKGGRAAHEKGTAHQFTPDEARAAGRKGGMVVSQHRDHMVEIGRSGGRARRRRKSDIGGQPGNEQSVSHGGPDEGQGRGDFGGDAGAGMSDVSNPGTEASGSDRGDLENEA